MTGQILVATMGCLKRAVHEYMLNRDFQLIVISAVNGNTTIELARLVLALLRRIGRPNFASILLRQTRRGDQPAAGSL